MFKRAEAHTGPIHHSAPEPTRAGPTPAPPRASARLNLPARARASEREGRGQRNDGVIPTSPPAEITPASLNRPHPHAPDHYNSTQRFNSTRATKPGRRRFQKVIGATPATSRAAAEQPRRRRWIPGRNREGKRDGKDRILTLDACAVTARKEGHHRAGNGAGDRRPAARKMGRARAPQAIPARFLLPGGAAGHGGADATNEEARRAPRRANRRRVHSARVWVGKKMNRGRERREGACSSTWGWL